MSETEELINMPLEEDCVAEDSIINKEILRARRRIRDRKYIRRFREEWLHDPKYKDWLCRDEEDDRKAFCKFCDCDLLAKLFNIEAHRISKKHKRYEALRGGDLNALDLIVNSRKKRNRKKFKSEDFYTEDHEIDEYLTLQDDDHHFSNSLINTSNNSKNKFSDQSKNLDVNHTLYIADHCTVKVLDSLPILTEEERSISLERLLSKEWCLVDGIDAIVKKYLFNSFNQAFAFITRIAICAEKNDHHPKWTNLYNTVEITWTTHSSAGLTIKDIKMANFCDNVYDEFNFD